MTSPSPNLLRGFRLVSAATHLDAWHAIHDGPPNGLWSVKPWRSGSCIPESWPQLVELEELRPYQTLVLREEDDKPVACAHCVPFYWPELPSSDYSLEGSLDWALSLPDRGWDEIMVRGIRQARARGGESPPPGNLTRDEALAWASNSPNALSALGSQSRSSTEEPASPTRCC